MTRPDAYLAEVRERAYDEIQDVPAGPEAAGLWSCQDVPRLLGAIEAVLALTRDTDGNDLPGEAEVPVGEFACAIHEALDGAT